MNISADTNVLLRSMLRDDISQAASADEILTQATTVAVSISALCEFVWVLRQGYGLSKSEAASAVEKLLDSRKVIVNRRVAEAGLAALKAGADFADGAIAFEGSWLGADTFVSFDRKAVAVLKADGFGTRLLR